MLTDGRALSGGGPFIPRVSMDDVSILVGPGNFFVAKFDQLQMVMLFFCRVFYVVHLGCNFHDLDVLQRGVEVLNFLASVIDFVPFELCFFERLSGCHGLVQIRGGCIDFFCKNKRRMNARAGQLSSIVIGGCLLYTSDAADDVYQV